MQFAFEIHDAHSGKIIGGTLTHKNQFKDAEEAFAAIYEQWQQIYPNREIHVEQVDKFVFEGLFDSLR